MGASYYQFCPVAKAMELLDERWTLLIVRELCSGSERFNEVRRGVPRMSPTLLSKRLTHLTRAGIVERVVDGTDVRYVLTPAGHELRPVVEALSVWGVRWIGELGDADLDPKLLLWDMRRSVDGDAVPAGRRTVVRFRFPDVPARVRDWWLVISPADADAHADTDTDTDTDTNTNAGTGTRLADADLCDADPGFEVDVTVTSRLRRLIEVWRGDLRWSDALRKGDIDVHGPEDLRRGLPAWFVLPGFAAVARPS